MCLFVVVLLQELRMCAANQNAATYTNTCAHTYSRTCTVHKFSMQRISKRNEPQQLNKIENEIKI